MKQSLDKQSEHTMSEFRDRMKKSMLDLNEQGLNVALYWENPDIRKYVNIVPHLCNHGRGHSRLAAAPRQAHTGELALCHPE